MPARRTPAKSITPTPSAESADVPLPSAQLPVETPESDRRTNAIDRRVGLDRRILPAEDSDYAGQERRSATDRRADTGLERRRGPGRRRADDRRMAEEGEMTAQQFEFVMAVETYKKVNRRLYPTWTEVLEVLQQLGYRKVAAREITLENVPEPELETLDEAA